MDCNIFKQMEASASLFLRGNCIWGHSYVTHKDRLLYSTTGKRINESKSTLYFEIVDLYNQAWPLIHPLTVRAHTSRTVYLWSKPTGRWGHLTFKLGNF